MAAAGVVAGGLGRRFMGQPGFPLGTAFVSNVGTLGLDEAFLAPLPFARTPVYLAVGTVQDRAVVVDGEVVARPVLVLVATADHRIVDGVHAGRMATVVREHLLHTHAAQLERLEQVATLQPCLTALRMEPEAGAETAAAPAPEDPAAAVADVAAEEAASEEAYFATDDAEPLVPYGDDAEDDEAAAELSASVARMHRRRKRTSDERDAGEGEQEGEEDDDEDDDDDLLQHAAKRRPSPSRRRLSRRRR